MLPVFKLNIKERGKAEDEEKKREERKTDEMMWRHSVNF